MFRSQNSVKVRIRDSWKMELPLLIEPTVPLSANASILICVASEAANMLRRKAIRETWGSTRSMRVIFFMGLPQGPNADLDQKLIAAESKSYGDLVQAKFHDTYKNLTLKTITMVQWTARSRWPGRRFVIKTDDDVFLNTPLFLLYVDHFTNGYLYGNHRYRAQPYRCVVQGCSKYGLTTTEYHPDEYPPYLLGLFYVFTERALERISKHLFEPRFLFIEDVYITGMVAARAGVTRCSMPDGIKINAWKPPKRTVKRLLRRSLMAQHIDDPSDHNELWDEVRSKLPYATKPSANS